MWADPVICVAPQPSPANLPFVIVEDRLFYLRLVLRVLRELVMLNDFSFILSRAIAHPDPSEVLCALTEEDDDSKIKSSNEHKLWL